MSTYTFSYEKEKKADLEWTLNTEKLPKKIQDIIRLFLEGKDWKVETNESRFSISELRWIKRNWIKLQNLLSAEYHS